MHDLFEPGDRERHERDKQERERIEAEGDKHKVAESIARLLQEIGESVEIYYEPRNEGMEWYVGFADGHGYPLPVHEHFADLVEGLLWLSRNGKQLVAGRPRDRDRKHPLDDEHVYVAVVLSHLETRATTWSGLEAPADKGPSMTEALNQAFNTAADLLLDKLEQQGGG